MKEAELFKTGNVPKTVPHIIHGNQNNIFPTHTHGLAGVGLPELFIHAEAFGLVNNANIINGVFVYLCLNPAEWNRVAKRIPIEIDIPDSDLILCVRPVGVKFFGVTMSYSPNDIDCPTGFAQLYIKGEDHTTTDEYFRSQYEKYKHLKDADCDCALCEKGENQNGK